MCKFKPGLGNLVLTGRTSETAHVLEPGNFLGPALCVVIHTFISCWTFPSKPIEKHGSLCKSHPFFDGLVRSTEVGI